LTAPPTAGTLSPEPVTSQIRENAPDEEPLDGEEGSDVGADTLLLPEPIEGAGTPPGDASDPRFETADDPRIPPNKQFFKIGEVAKITGLKPYVLRYWETEFPWIRPAKTSARQRLYRRQDVAILLQIKRLRHEEQRTIADAKALIREHRGGDRPGRRKSSLPPPPKVRLEAPVGAMVIDLGPVLAEMRHAVLGMLEAAEE
jgi:DNA-binding transcriptional MerR regulator